jgi:hypothetical protein
MLHRRLVPTFVLATALAACGGPPREALAPELRTGPADGEKPRRVLVAPPYCGSVEARCLDDLVRAVDAIVRSQLEFKGYHVLGPEELLLTTRARTENHEGETTTTTTTSTTKSWRVLPGVEEHTSGTEVRRTAKHIELVGSTFEDLAVAERRALLREVNADGVAVVRLVLGARHSGWSGRKTVEVLVKLGQGEDEVLAWVARCAAPTDSWGEPGPAAENAARCAMSAVR